MSWTKDLTNIARDQLNSLIDASDISGMVTRVGSLSSYDGAVSMVTSIQDGLVATATSIMVLFFLYGLLSDAMNETFSLERFIKLFARLALGIGLISLCGDITTLGDSLATEVSDVISKAKDGAKLTASDMPTVPEAENLFQGVFLVMGLWAVGTVMSWVIQAAMYFMLFSRLIEMALRAAFMPIAMAMVTDGGWQGTAGRYIKKYIALCLQGPALVAISSLYNSFLQSLVKADWDSVTKGTTGIGPTLLAMIALMFATIGMSKQSITVLNDVMGV